MLLVCSCLSARWSRLAARKTTGRPSRLRSAPASIIAVRALLNLSTIFRSGIGSIVALVNSLRHDGAHFQWETQVMVMGLVLLRSGQMV
ncbi:hypothetical protein BDY21DRAFT_332585 [Lineolata rhizophorae]|uniref:Uncharacterized protein n=1 Tax=Lineolata rhizophorae TaxID=578093 RepID=A0A6A6PCC5_9PEZI|nr:hypothetical protein BDY21DRAFT_332585 [Lineolata rhizophorae]